MGDVLLLDRAVLLCSDGQWRVAVLVVLVREERKGREFDENAKTERNTHKFEFRRKMTPKKYMLLLRYRALIKREHADAFP